MLVIRRCHSPSFRRKVASQANWRLFLVDTRQLPGGKPCCIKLQVFLSGAVCFIVETIEDVQIVETVEIVKVVEIVNSSIGQIVDWSNRQTVNASLTPFITI